MHITSTLTPFVKPHTLLIWAIQNIFYILHSIRKLFYYKVQQNHIIISTKRPKNDGKVYPQSAEWHTWNPQLYTIRSRSFFQCLEILNTEKLQLWQNVCNSRLEILPKTKKPSKDCQWVLNLAKVAKFRQIWSHFIRIDKLLPLGWNYKKPLAIFDGLFSICENVEPTWANFVCYWANFHLVKWPKIEK